MGIHHDHHDHYDHDDVFHTHTPINKMKTAFFLTFIILIVQFIGGIISHSLSLLSDAGHVLTDIAAIGLSWFALSQAKKPPNEKLTFGYHRAGILAALLNAATLIIIAIIITYEAYWRIRNPIPVTGTWMFIGASFGLIINLYLTLGLSKHDNINVRATVLHILGDAIASAGVIIGGIIIHFTGWYIIDPILSVLIAFIIAFGAWQILKQTLGILMEGVPHGISVNEIIELLRSVKGVHDIHDLHIWSLTSGQNALSCHLVMDGVHTIHESQVVLRTIEHDLAHKGISHVTIQIEDHEHPHDDLVFGCEVEKEIHHHHYHHHHAH
jgi:cobalt-zinc-cadmium efflux system protein